MDIQSRNTFKTFNSKNYFKSYLDQTLNVKPKYPAYGKCSMGTYSVTLSILKEYTGNSYEEINTFLRNGDYRIKWPSGPPAEIKVKNKGNGILEITSTPTKPFIEAGRSFAKIHEKISSLFFSLLGAAPYEIKELDDIPQYTKVYRGVTIKPPSTWKVGDEFYFAEFISTSLDKKVAEVFGTYIFIITLKGKGYKGVERLSYFPHEKEVIIAAYSKFKITKIDGNYYYMDQFDC